MGCDGMGWDGMGHARGPLAARGGRWPRAGHPESIEIAKIVKFSLIVLK